MRKPNAFLRSAAVCVLLCVGAVGVSLSNTLMSSDRAAADTASAHTGSDDPLPDASGKDTHRRLIDGIPGSAPAAALPTDVSAALSDKETYTLTFDGSLLTVADSHGIAVRTYAIPRGFYVTEDDAARLFGDGIRIAGREQLDALLAFLDDVS